MLRVGAWVLVGWLVLAGGRSAAADDATSSALLDRAIKAAGGEAKLAKMRLVHVKGKGTVYDPSGNEIGQLTFDGSLADQDRLHMDGSITVAGMQMPVVVVINRDKAWAVNRGKTEEAPREALEPILQVLHTMRLPSMLPALRDKQYSLSPLGEVKVGERPAVGLRVARKDHPDVSLFLDKETGLPVRCETRIKEGNGKEAAVAFLYSAPKDFGGVRHGSKITILQDDKRVGELELTAAEPKDKLEDTLFNKP